MKKIAAVFSALLLCLQVFASAEAARYVSRIEFVSYLMSAMGIISSPYDAGFSDLSEENRYYNYVAAAKEYGICSGYGDNTFRGENSITRQDAVLMLCRAYKIEPASGIYISGYADFSEIGDYAVGAVSAAAKNGIIKYEPKAYFDPNGYITVEEMVSLNSALKKYGASHLNFSVGYPKQTREQAYKAVTVSVKTTRACTIYYKLLPASAYIGGYKPRAEEITDFLTAVSIADKAVDVNIYPPDFNEYNLYIVAKEENGEYSEVECIKNVTAHRYSVGRGTKEEPYEIYTVSQLEGIKYYPTAHFSLKADIELSEKWEPIEPEQGHLGFAGVLEGNYHHITGVNVNKYSKNAGLFAAVYGGKIKNLYVDADVRGTDNVGVITGLLEGGSISGCFVTGVVRADGSNAGGICGTNNGEIINSVSAAYMVEASAYAGGVCGNNKAEITSCLSAAYTVTADMYASSIAGVNFGGTVKYNVAASFYANDIITTKSGRITTNKQYGTTKGNYCYDKMISGANVNFDYDSHDGLEVSWGELTSAEFYSEVMGWDTENIWNDSFSADFRLNIPRGFENIDMIKGLTMYAPIQLYSEEELMAVCENPNYHYILMNDIKLSESSSWNMIGDDKSEETGFNGSFDGNGYTISGLHTEQSDEEIYGMFGVISAGTVRNLKLTNVSIEGHSLAGGLCGINYGYIENCSVSGRIYLLRKNNILSVGGICGNNYGYIENVSADITLRADGQVLTAGGIAANNEGLISNAYCKGRIRAEQRLENTNAVVGGICGINTQGEVYNSSSDVEITSRAATGYVGGIAGIMNSGKLSENSFDGKIFINSKREYESAAYVGGIAGLVPEGTVINSRTSGNIFVQTNRAYVGGVVGYNQNAVIQNTYTAMGIDIYGGIFDDFQGLAGGICGYSEGGTISENVSQNSIIKGNVTIGKIANADLEYAFIANNYYDEKMSVDAEEGDINPDENATALSSGEFSEELFFKSIFEGGRLGWNDGIWYFDEKTGEPKLRK